MDPLESNLVVAVDIGGSKVALGIINARGSLLGEAQNHLVPFDERGIADPEALIELVAPLVEQAHSLPGRLCGIGLSVCGNIDPLTGEAVLVPNLHWRNMPFGEMVQRRFSLPVYSATDVRMAALAEAVWGAARNLKHFAWVTLGTGFGAYLFLNKRLFGGSHGFAGNFGHNTIDEINGYPCGCGRRGCLETFVAGPAIARAGQAALDENRSPVLSQLAGGRPVTTEMVFQAEALGDPAAGEIIDRVIRMVSIGLAGLVNILDLELIILGGGVMRASANLLERINRRTRDFLETVEARRDLRILGETFSNSALYGSAANFFALTDILPECSQFVEDARRPL